MLKAIVDGCESLATPKAVGSCPLCDSQVIAKCGSMVVWHWAHASLADCDLWSEGETDWHAAWKSRFSRTEETITKQIGGSVVKHRADAVTSRGRVIEFQHSSISAEEIRERERFYGDMIWVIDGCEAYFKNRVGFISVRPADGQEYVKFKWKSRKRSFDNAEAPVFVDVGMAFIEVGEQFIKHKDWWDDCDDGLRDGIRRHQGVWQRIIQTHCLLEIKKRSEGFGWGRLVPHDDFCTRFEGESVGPFRYRRALRLQSAHWSDDGFTYAHGVDPWCQTKWGRSRPWHSWCHEILNPSKDGAETA